MDLFFKTIGAVLIAVILYLVLNKSEKDMAAMLSVLVCILAACAAMSFLSPVIEFFYEIKSVAQLDSDMMNIVLKTVGIGLLGEVVSMVCSDAGNASMAKVIQILSAAVILWMSLPLFTALLSLVKEILNNI